jgi:hypothetical protein
VLAAGHAQFTFIADIHGLICVSECYVSHPCACVLAAVRATTATTSMSILLRAGRYIALTAHKRVCLWRQELFLVLAPCVGPQHRIMQQRIRGRSTHACNLVKMCSVKGADAPLALLFRRASASSAAAVADVAAWPQTQQWRVQRVQACCCLCLYMGHFQAIIRCVPAAALIIINRHFCQSAAQHCLIRHASAGR